MIYTDDKLEILNQGTQIQMNPDYSNTNNSEQHEPTQISGNIETESKLKMCGGARKMLLQGA